MPVRLAVLLVLFSAPAGAANLPWKVPFQGRLMDPATNAPRNGTYDLTFRLYSQPSGGTAFYTEAQSVPVSNGLFSTFLGQNAPLHADLFAGSSVYLGVTVDPDSEMTPRQQLAMSPYAVTAAQLAADGAARVNVGTAYSTFTSAGNLLVSAGVSASSGSFVNGVTASSGTFTATGATQYSISASSGVNVAGGTLRVAGSGGASVLYGVRAATVTVSEFLQSTAPASAPAAGPTGTARVYFDGSKDEWLLSASGRGYTPLGTMSTTMWNTDATAVVANQGSNLPAALTEFDSAVQGTRMAVDCDDLPGQLAIRYNFRASAATALTIVMSVRDVTNTANVLATVSQAVNAAQTWTGQGAYAAKPGWCSGTQTVAVYTSGGNGAADYIFKHIILMGKP